MPLRTTRTRPTRGTPQGGVISPLLANVHLHWFERTFHGSGGPSEWGGAQIVRYADNFVGLARWMSPRLIKWIESQLEGRFWWTINRTKTCVVSHRKPGASLDFLGFTMRSLKWIGPVTAHAPRRTRTGKPDAGNPHVRFDEGGGGKRPSPTRPCLRENKSP